jgi:hypothetical protein
MKIMPLTRIRSFVLAAISVLLLIPAGAAQAQAEVSVGSAMAAKVVAVSRTGRQWGIGHAVGGDRNSVSIRAAQEAMSRCARSDCRVQFQSVNPNDRCMTIAQGLRGGYAIGIGASTETASREALNSCRIMGYECRIAENRCY